MIQILIFRKDLFIYFHVYFNLMCECLPESTYIHITCIPGVCGGHRRLWIPQDWNYQQLCTTIRVTRTEIGSIQEQQALLTYSSNLSRSSYQM